MGIQLVSDPVSYKQSLADCWPIGMRRMIPITLLTLWVAMSVCAGSVVISSDVGFQDTFVSRLDHFFDVSVLKKKLIRVA